MAIDINIIQHNDFLEIVVTGSYDLNDAVNKFPHVLDVCRLTGLQKVLIDYRDLQGEGGGIEKCIYVWGIAEHYQKYLTLGGHELQVAYIRPKVTDYEPGVEIGNNIGLPFKLFDKPNETHKWLGVNST